jgi:hypothetical protein
VMVVEPVQSFWQDTSCLSTTVNQKKVAPICQHDRVCPGGWKEFDGHCYQLSMSEATWENAEADCYNKGGHLASIHSVEENNFISKLYSLSTWLGASDIAHEVVKIKLVLHKLGYTIDSICYINWDRHSHFFYLCK